MSLLSRVLRDPHQREVRRHMSLVERINALEEQMEALSDADLLDQTRRFRERLGVEGPDLSLGQPITEALVEEEEDEDALIDRRQREEEDAEGDRAVTDLLPEAFATVREAARRHL